LGDAHVYLNHLDGLEKQLLRAPHPLPKVRIKAKPFFDLAFEDFELADYVHDPFIKFPVAV
jgi:thymidylate synthase